MAPYLETGAKSARGMEVSVARRPLNTSSVPLSDRHKDILMERLQFLETRILEVSRKIGKGDGSSSSSTVPSSSSVAATEETKWLLNPSVQLKGKGHVWRYSSYNPLTSHERKAKNDDGEYRTQMLTTTEREESMDALEASEKAKHEMHSKEERKKKKKVGWKRLCKKWLPLGCL